MNKKRIEILSGLLLIFFIITCSKTSKEIIELKHIPLDNLNGIINKTGIQIDPEISSDGNGSLKFITDKPTTFKLFEIDDINIENAKLIYQAKIRTEDVEGHVFLEMWCGFRGKGEFFSRALQSPLSGSQEWTFQETPFFLKKGENPDYVKLNLVVNGRGVVWIDDIHLLKASLK